MANKKTLVIGASENSSRYSYMAIHQLRARNHDVMGLAKRVGQVADVPIQTNFPQEKNIHTVTLYIGAKHQSEYYDAMIALNPKRVIFNPGTENEEFKSKLLLAGMEVIEVCTFVMLSTGQY